MRKIPEHVSEDPSMVVSIIWVCSLKKKNWCANCLWCDKIWSVETCQIKTSNAISAQGQHGLVCTYSVKEQAVFITELHFASNFQQTSRRSLQTISNMWLNLARSWAKLEMPTKHQWTSVCHEIILLMMMWQYLCW
jgi:hypothetical protein